MKSSKSVHPALSFRGMVLGVIGSAVITASSLYVALKLGALPWPIVFAALISLFFLKALGNTSLNEANVTHTAMSAGAMVAGGLAFTIPGLWMLGQGSDISLAQLMIVSLSGTVLGLAATAVVRHFFIDVQDLPYPIGYSAAESLQAANENQGRRTAALFGGMGFAAIYTLLRDAAGVLPKMLFSNIKIPGVNFGLYNSPMLIATGFIIGPVACLVWFIGGLIGDFGCVVGASSFGLWDVAFGQSVKSSLGLGMMLGCGLGIVVTQCIPAIRRHRAKDHTDTAKKASDTSAAAASTDPSSRRPMRAIIMTLISCAIIAVATIALSIPLPAAALMVIGTWVCVIMSSQAVGTTGVDPMEVFGVLILLLIQALCSGVSMVSLFMIAAIVAVACGLTGDVMNDFKAGSILHTRPRDQWIAQVIGGLVGAVVASLVLYAMLNAYGADAFGAGKTFVAAQASVVAAMVGGVPNLPAFLIGAAIGLVLTCCKLPVMTLGLGVYLPFYLTLTAAIGGLVRWVYNKIRVRRHLKGDGTALAAGILGGESLVGVALAFVVMLTAL